MKGFKLKLFTKIIALADVVFVLSENYHKKFYQKYIDEKKLVVLENFINVKAFDHDIEFKNPNFLYVGRLSEKKGFLTLVKAVSKIKEQLQDLKIHVLGTYENKAFEDLCKAIIEENKINNFVFHGAVMGSEKITYFKENSVFIFPSYFENSPIVLKEATAAKMAILAADIEENKILVQDFNNTLFFKAKDDRDLAKKILHLYHNKSLVKEFILQSQKAEIFDDKQAIKVIEKYLIH
ncbi:MAG: glycosyltransferase family 4 protein [Flavobacteriaceae bacterium]|nr:glycosyltransferase family 4 protein [Flavobacteriaceae bacterium]